jgi:glycerophosphoryl diester phosphodiesterase
MASVAPENTMASYRAALGSRADYIECDVRLCADDTIVMMHDPSVDRTTNGDAYLREETYDAVRNLDAGSWYAPEFSNEYVPTLREVFRLVKGKKRLVLDVKDADMTYHLMSLLEEEGAEKGDVVVFSFEWQVIEESLVAQPDWDVVFLDDELSEEADVRADEIERVLRIGCTGIGVSVQRIDQEFVAMAQDAGLAVYCYTANHPSHIQKLNALGVDAIISDRPNGVLEILEK